MAGTNGYDQRPQGYAPTGDKAKEEMARQIARNMSFGDTGSFDTEPYHGQQEAQGGGTAVKTAPKKKTSSQKTTGAKKSSGTKKSTSSKGSPSSKGKKKKAKKKSKAPLMILITLIVVIVCGCCGFYLVGMNSYKDTFLDNTYINDINVSGKTRAQAYELLKQNQTIPESVSFIRPNGQVFKIDMESIGFKDTTKEQILKFFNEQDHYSWFSARFKNTHFEFTNKFSYDRKKLENELKRKALEAQTAAEPKDATIVQEDGKGFTIVPEQMGDKVDESKLENLYEFAAKQLDQEIFEIDLTDADCYAMPKVTAAMLADTCDRLNGLYNIELNFDFTYATEALTGDEVMDWVIFNGDDIAEGYTVDEDKAMAYVEGLAEKYDTYGKDRTFNSTNHGEITVDAGSGCYGWWIDQEKTKDLICELIEKGESDTVEPIYYVNPDSQYEYTCNPEWRTAEKDYGDTYVEVDLTAQHLWYYKDGKVEMESDIVSGYPNESRNTPEGVYKVWIKERSKTLTGSADGRAYSSYVDYWNNISTIGIGLHDASWQNGVFGGEKYKSATWGSHGCINMPFDKAKYVYENIDYGTPVFAYWSD
ncbi:MAG: peptidoglycan binding domain-containing protein [Ruminococcus sp.]|nr:peptidoglycan binding domain-containing protein [Ruminococcus sp.]